MNRLLKYKQLWPVWEFFREVFYGQREEGIILNILMFPLWLLSLVFRVLLSLRKGVFAIGIKKKQRLPCRVISVGNITFGGTGKTSMVEYLARELNSRGVKVAVIGRGYGGSKKGVGTVSNGNKLLMGVEEAGDEPYLLACKLMDIHVPVISGADRYEGGRFAIKEFQADAIILDDCFQYIKLERDVDILMVKSKKPFGNRHLIPRGGLREPINSVFRSDCVVKHGQFGEGKMGKDETKKTLPEKGTKTQKGILYTTKKVYEGPDVFTSRIEYGPINMYSNGQKMPVENLKGKSALAFCGLADPLSFFEALCTMGLQISEKQIYPDHYYYTTTDLKLIKTSAQVSQADYIITTQKDAVRLGNNPEVRSIFDSTPELLVVGSSLTMVDDRDRFMEKVAGKLGGPQRGKAAIED